MQIKKIKIPIAMKIIGLTVTILIGATAWMAKQTSDYLHNELLKSQDYSNMIETTSRSKEVENILATTLERAQNLGNLLGKSKEDKNASESFDSNFEKDKNLISLELWKVTSHGFEFISRRTKTSELEALHLNKDWISEIHQKAAFPLQSVVQKHIEIRNSSVDSRLPLLTLGIPLTKDDRGQVAVVELLDYKLSLLQKPFSQQSERSFYLLDRLGNVLAHQTENLATKRSPMGNYPIVAKAMADTNPQRQLRFLDPDTRSAFIGAYIKNSFFGVTTVAQTSEDIILQPAREVQRKAYHVAGIVVSVALFLCFLFSMTLTGPLEKLAELIEVVSKGNFDVKARSIVHSNDEVGDLAVAFDHMTDGLKERDKVKSLFSKFHGSSVAEDLIKNDIAVGGTKKDVTVFFSDIRGFTQFSEGHTPEQVVAMLNEYFGVMVKIINEKGGVVDKFIGDAIMAVWGAPHRTDHDTALAISAALEMRVALAKLNETRLQRGQTAILMGMGLHCGPAISGTIGSEERMEYTVIGDTVNMTSRIESSTKAFGTDLLVSEAVMAKTEKEFAFVVTGSAEVKGKSEPLKLYSVLGPRSSTGEIQEISTAYSSYQSEKADKVKVAG